MSVDTANRHVVICCRGGAGRPETTMNQTKPSNGPADVRLSATAAAVLETLRRHGAPTRASMVYSDTDAIPAENVWDLKCGATQTALRELIDAGLVVATDRDDGETVYALAPERPVRPYTDDDRDAVLGAVESDWRTAYGVYGHTTPSLESVRIGEILADLVADGDVIREVRGDAYVYRLAPPPEPPLPDVDNDVLEWLRLLASNNGSLYAPWGGVSIGPRDWAASLDLTHRVFAGRDGDDVRHTLTDLGRRVLAAADKGADRA